MKRHAILFLTVFSIAIVANAADKWTTLRSGELTFVGNASESQIRAVAVEFEQFRDAVSQSLGITSTRSSIPITVVVFKSAETFAPFKPQEDGKAVATSGFFYPSEDAHYIAVTAGSPIPRAVYHQYIHEMTRDLPSTVPVWLVEGLAEFFSYFEIMPKEKQFAVGKMNKEHVDVLKKGQLLAFNDLFAFDRGSPQYNERDLKGAYYAESYALVNYLMVGLNATRQTQIGDFLKLITEGKPAPESFQTAFKNDYKTMAGELDYYVREKTEWTQRGTPLKDKSAIEKEMKPHALTDAEAEFYSGDLLLHMNRFVEAEPHLKQATTLDPKLASAHSAMGLALYRQEKVPEAIGYLKRAVELEPKNYLAQYNYAYVLDKNSTSPLDDLDAKREALGKAIELAPRYAPAYELLAYINLTADIDYNGTIELLQNAYKLAPGNANLKFLLAQALVKKEEFAQANNLLRPLLDNTAVSAAVRDGARNLINLIARKEETSARENEAFAAEAKRDEEEAKAAARTRAAAAESAAAQPETPSTPPAAAPAGPRPRSGELVAVNPVKPKVDGPQIKGLMTLVDCRGGLTLTVKSGADTLKLHSDSPEKIEFVSYVPTVSASLSCGPAPGQGIPVVITYKPTPGGPNAGEPLVVEFVEK